MVFTAALLVLLSPTVPATDPGVRLIGRFDLRDAAGPRCAWPASTVELRVNGTKVVATIHEEGSDLLEAVVDGKPIQTIKLEKDGKYEVALGASGVHTLRLSKRTESFMGTTQFKSFDLQGGKLLPPIKAKRRIEIVGDSISCGYGDEGPNQYERWKPETENGYLAYGPVAANLLGADWTVIAWSGRKMWPDNTVPEIYDLTLPNDPTSQWAFKGPAPDAIVINLATNDFGPGNPDETGWTNAYDAFIQRLRKVAPKAMIYCAIGSMMADDNPPRVQPLTTLRNYLTRMVTRIHERGDKKVAIIEFPVQKQEDGIGSDWHPSLKTQAKMGAQLAARLKQDLHW